MCQIGIVEAAKLTDLMVFSLFYVKFFPIGRPKHHLKFPGEKLGENGAHIFVN